MSCYLIVNRTAKRKPSDPTVRQFAGRVLYKIIKHRSSLENQKQPISAVIRSFKMHAFRTQRPAVRDPGFRIHGVIQYA
jgi:hypothetical protein